MKFLSTLLFLMTIVEAYSADFVYCSLDNGVETIELQMSVNAPYNAKAFGTDAQTLEVRDYSGEAITASFFMDSMKLRIQIEDEDESIFSVSIEGEEDEIASDEIIVNSETQEFQEVFGRTQVNGQSVTWICGAR